MSCAAALVPSMVWELAANCRELGSASARRRPANDAGFESADQTEIQQEGAKRGTNAPTSADTFSTEDHDVQRHPVRQLKDWAWLPRRDVTSAVAIVARHAVGDGSGQGYPGLQCDADPHHHLDNSNNNVSVLLQ